MRSHSAKDHMRGPVTSGPQSSESTVRWLSRRKSMKSVLAPLYVASVLAEMARAATAATAEASRRT